jgi:Asp-tRNA(Asn)/Glu-tRNA(Gln) amidotransferase A subunit family amidase
MPQRRANELGLAEAARAIREGSLTCVGLLEACLERIDARDKLIAAWECIDPDGAMAEARRLDKMKPDGLLHGIPLAVKDVIDTADMATRCGSAIYDGRRPRWDASCVALVRRAGAIPLGKTVSTEFAYFAPGKTANPRNPAHTPGGSSSGSAAAVADMMVPGGFGTQTAASIIRPAAYCGVVGYKPSFGEFSLAGIKPFAESFDTLGLITRSVEDLTLLRAALLGQFSAPALEWKGRAPRIGLCRTLYWHHAEAATQRAIEDAAETLARSGAHVDDATLPQSFDALVDTHKLMMAYEAARSLAYEYDAHGARLSPQLKALIEEGMRCPREAYVKACMDARRARDELALRTQSWDALLTPSATAEAPRGLGSTGDPLFGRMWTLLHVPCITLPGMLGPAGMPIGVQLVGAFGGDEQLLALAKWAAPLIANPIG